MRARGKRGQLVIAVVIPFDSNQAYDLMRGIAEFAAIKPGVSVLSFNKTQPLNARVLHQLDVHGVIARVSTAVEETALARLRRPVVNVSGAIATPKLVTVNTDDHLVGALAAGYFHRRGYRTLAYYGDGRHQASLLRCAGLTDEARRLGIARAHIRQLLERPKAQLAKSRDKLEGWLRRLVPPVGLLAFDDLTAAAVVASCLTIGLGVPRDVGVIGVGNDPERLALSPVPLSALELDSRRIGYRAAELLYAMCKERRIPPAEHLVKPLKIVTRRSTDQYAVADEKVALALDFIREHLANTIYVPEIARAAGCSRRSLEARFRAAVGRSIYDHVQRERVERAREVLATTDLSVAEVAAACGFESANRFGLVFRRQIRMTPGAFRSRLKRSAADPNAGGAYN